MLVIKALKKLKNIREEKYARFVPLPNDNEPCWKFDGKCSVCRTWGFNTDKYCANCGAKFDKEGE